MSNGRGKHKSRGKRRVKKVSAGINGGARRSPLSAVERVLVGKGLMARRHIGLDGNAVEDRTSFGKYMKQRQDAILARSEEQAA